MSGARSRGVGPACAVAAVASLAAVAGGLAAGADAAEGWQLAARYTARLAFPIFLAAFVASPWHRLRPGPASRWLLRHRRAVGLAFATVFAAHLVSLVTFNVLEGTVPDAPTLVVGGGALLAIAALLERWLRTPRGGITSQPADGPGGPGVLLESAGAAVLLGPAAAPADSSQAGQGGRFGGGGASGQY